MHRLFLSEYGNVEGVERHGDHRVEADGAEELGHLLFAEHGNSAIEVRFGQRVGGVEFHCAVVNQEFVFAGEIWRAARHVKSCPLDHL